MHFLVSWSHISKQSREVIINTITIDKNYDQVYNFFINIKNWEKGGALKNIHKLESQDLWEVDTPTGKAQIKLKPNKQFGILDHDFIGSGGDSWTVYCRLIKTRKVQQFRGHLLDQKHYPKKNLKDSF